MKKTWNWNWRLY